MSLQTLVTVSSHPTKRLMNYFPDSSHLRTPATSTLGPLTPELMHRMNAYWRAANYLSVGQIYLYDNPLLKRRDVDPYPDPGTGAVSRF